MGEVAYYGYTKDLGAFLCGLGYVMPAGHNPADFVIDVLCSGKGPDKPFSLEAEPREVERCVGVGVCGCWGHVWVANALMAI
jgi:hypothetical protein